MIVVIISIPAVLTLPFPATKRANVNNRRDTQAELLRNLSFMERFFIENSSFSGAVIAATVNTDCYTLEFTSLENDSIFIVLKQRNQPIQPAAVILIMLV